MSQGFLLRKDDYPNGIQTSGDVERLAALLNPYLTSINTLVAAGGVSLSNNFDCEVQTGVFSHNLASGFSLKKLQAAKGCVVLGCDKAKPRSVIMRSIPTNIAGSLPRVSVTIGFEDSTTAGAKVSLLFLPEGQLFTAA